MSEASARSKSSSKGKLPELSDLLVDGRLRARLSQAELGARASVSSRTIGELERNDRDHIRFEPVVKLCSALGGDVRAWLDAAGHPEVSEQAAQALVDELNATRAAAEPGEGPGAVSAPPVLTSMPAVASTTIGAWLQTCRRAAAGERLIVVWRSSPGAAEREELIGELVPHVTSGMGLVIAVPYPWPGDEQGAVQPDLRARLLTAYAKVEAFTQRVRDALSPERAKDVHLFERTGGEGAMPPPPLWLRTWPLVLKHAGEDVPPSASVELAEWILTPTTLEPRLTWEPSGGVSPHTDEQQAQAALWGDYLGPLLHTKMGAGLAGWRLRHLGS